MIENKILNLDELEAYETYCYCQFTASSNHLHLTDISFEHCIFPEQDYSRTEFLDCHFKNIVFSNYNFSGSVFYRCTFERCQLLGTVFSENRWKDTKIIASRCEYIHCNKAILENIMITDTNLKEAFFQDVSIKNGLTFIRCDLSMADFSETSLADVDFSASDFDTLVFSPHLLRGVILEPFQAAQFMLLLGAIIKD